MTDTTVHSSAAGPCAAAHRSPYVGYARMDELHDLQDPRTGSPFELSFILLSQVKELLFRMVHLEVDQARAQLRADRAGDACGALSRATRTQRVLISCWESMNGMPVDEFLTFRDVLGEASGTQSFMYRRLEFALGNKNPALTRPEDLRLYPELRAELDSPSLYDEALRFLRREGLPVPADALDRDVTRTHRADERIEQVWAQVYRDPAAHPAAYRLAEHLLEVAYQFSHWRAAHLLVVERMLGGKRGSGGTDGAAWLREINEHRFFPELWTMRTLL
ncbi:tryptophan 2,3-dioxygenase [Thermomonospora echinospora]|uniref:Tryptophan 2,3-dioxygenase n=1 Tax=Thermomonospora echinospora TaxID=1992 RepID=A0A1H6DDR7_9ACTN|nr:tryptophan 2,3-dioxygenase family protein [Thermomonospora echinospora]SEG83597.1 tryptophan 2,3-dioxygenase [Thermomonospora echinospora]